MLPTFTLVPDPDAIAAALDRQRNLTKPPRSLGRLEDLAVALAGLQGTPFPQARPAACVLFAADHPVVRHGVSAYPAEVTAAMVRNFVQGGAAASVLAKALGMSLTVADVGVAHPYEATGSSATLVRDPVATHPAGDLRVEPAMSSTTLLAALEAGRRVLDGLPGVRVVAIGEMGIGNTTPAACLVAALLGASPDAIVGRGTGIDDDALARKRAVVADALRRARSREPFDLLAEVGGREIAAMVGAMARAAERRVGILVDGFIATSAALVLARANPSTRHAMFFAHRSREIGHRHALDALDARPLLELEMALGEATGALAAYPLVELACLAHESMATFAEAAVPNGQ